ncbi:MAG: hypothetical protein RR607_02960, partial [Akkermansia sp.]
MKQTLFLIALSCACLTSAQANTVSIDFGYSETQTASSINITEEDLVSNPNVTKEKLLKSMQGTVQLEIKGWTGNSGPTK